MLKLFEDSPLLKMLGTEDLEFMLSIIDPFQQVQQPHWQVLQAESAAEATWRLAHDGTDYVFFNDGAIY